MLNPAGRTTFPGKDIVSAFNMLKKEGVIAGLQHSHAPTRIISYVESFLAPRTFPVQWDGIVRGQATMHRGSPQGSPLSPVIWLIYITKLLKRAEERIEYITIPTPSPRLKGKYETSKTSHTFLFS